MLALADHRTRIEDELEPGRAERGGAGRKSEPPVECRQAPRAAVDRDLETRANLLLQPARVGDAAERRDVVTRLERRDLGEVEDVVDVGAVAGDDNLGMVVRREVAEGMGGGNPCEDERRERCGQHCRDASHAVPSAPARFRFAASARVAIGAHRIENSGFRRSACRYQRRIPTRSPAHPAA